MLFVVLSIGFSIFYQTRRNYKFVEVDQDTRQTYINYLNKQVSSNEYKYTKQEMRQVLEDEVGLRLYWYKEDDIPNGGYSVGFYRIIYMDRNVGIEQYCFILCHEMCHIKHYTANEIYTNFMTFKTLYESDDPELRQAGTWFGIYLLNRGYNQEYDCSWLIVDYLVDKI